MSASLQAYYDAISRAPYRPLTAARERELAARVQSGDQSARNALVRACVRFVCSVARTYLSSGLPMEDLIQAGNLGLVRAAELFRPERNIKFISYAVWWIRQAILLEISYQSRAISLPPHMSVQMYRVRLAAERAEQDLRRQAQAEDLRGNDALIRRAMAADMPPLWLDAPISDDGRPTTVLDAIRPDDDDDDMPADEHDQMAVRLQAVLQAIPPRERRAISQYHGIGMDGTSMTLDQIAAAMGVTRERIRQLRNAAARRIRKMPEAAALREYL